MGIVSRFAGFVRTMTDAQPRWHSIDDIEQRMHRRLLALFGCLAAVLTAGFGVVFAYEGRYPQASFTGAMSAWALLCLAWGRSTGRAAPALRVLCVGLFAVLAW